MASDDSLLGMLVIIAIILWIVSIVYIIKDIKYIYQNSKSSDNDIKNQVSKSKIELAYCSIYFVIGVYVIYITYKS